MQKSGPRPATRFHGNEYTWRAEFVENPAGRNEAILIESCGMCRLCGFFVPKPVPFSPPAAERKLIARRSQRSDRDQRLFLHSLAASLAVSDQVCHDGVVILGMAFLRSCSCSSSLVGFGQTVPIRQPLRNETGLRNNTQNPCQYRILDSPALSPCPGWQEIRGGKTSKVSGLNWCVPGAANNDPRPLAVPKLQSASIDSSVKRTLSRT